MTTATLPSDLRQMARDMSVEARVPSFTEPDTFYVVRYACTPFPFCSCPDFHYRGFDKGTCKHIAITRRTIKLMAKLVKKVSLEMREQAGARQRHPTARGAATLHEASTHLQGMTADPTA